MAPDARALLRARAAAAAAAAAAGSKPALDVPNSSAHSTSSSRSEPHVFSSSSAAGITDPFAVYSGRNRALRCKACDVSIKHEALWSSHASSKSHRSHVLRLRTNLMETEERQRAERNTSASALASDTDKKRPAEEEDVVQQAEEKKKQRMTQDPHLAEEGLQEDEEWARFQAEVLNAHVSSEDGVAKYIDSTIEVAPVLRGEQASNSEATAKQQHQQAQAAAAPEVAAETEEEKRQRLDREAREEIYARMEEEQRLQDEADERVTALRARLERLKAARLVRRKPGDTSAAQAQNKGNGVAR